MVSGRPHRGRLLLILAVRGGLARTARNECVDKFVARLDRRAPLHQVRRRNGFLAAAYLFLLAVGLMLIKEGLVELQVFGCLFDGRGMRAKVFLCAHRGTQLRWFFGRKLRLIARATVYVWRGNLGLPG